MTPAQKLARRDLVDQLRELHKVADRLGDVVTADLVQRLDEGLYLLTTALVELDLVTRADVRYT